MRRVVGDSAKVRPCSLLFCVMMLSCARVVRENDSFCQRESAYERERVIKRVTEGK